MKIAVLDGYAENPGDLSWDPIREFGEVTVYDRVSYEESPAIAEAIGDAEIVVLNKTPVSKETIDRCPDIRMITVLATGYNIVDTEYCREKGIPVCNVPVYGTWSV
ncbi:MAG: D-2-hydroxyacid dehydrogenase, partial [Lachnospiraceae bacterium]|nr:D-2-hydroxyacid dehydrogenase [Lachnospiraceae bacterium]